MGQQGVSYSPTTEETKKETTIRKESSKKRGLCDRIEIMTAMGIHNSEFGVEVDDRGILARA